MSRALFKAVGINNVHFSHNWLVLEQASSVILKLSLDLEELSDGDLLNQYSFSKAKKFKESGEDGQSQKSISAIENVDSSGNSVIKESSNSLPRVRNKFASFLQRKNKQTDAVIVPGTRSRYACVTCSNE